MSLTGFNRLRRAKQVEAMKPENIIKEEKKIEPLIETPKEIIEEKPIEIKEPEIKETIKEEIEEKPETTTRRRTTTRRN